MQLQDGSKGSLSPSEEVMNKNWYVKQIIYE
jgi:hypothetical protein